VQQKKTETLCTLLRRLGNVVPDSDELGLLIGYAIADSLISFRSTSGDGELQKEEIRAVYLGLENMIEAIGKEGSDCASYMSLCDLKSRVDPEMHLVMQSGFKGESPLLNEMAQFFRGARRNYQDVLRRQGLRLYKQSTFNYQAPLSAKRPDLMERDYRTIREYFT
jgi:hypothetical protein